jgi:hypothetical protein
VFYAGVTQLMWIDRIIRREWTSVSSVQTVHGCPAGLRRLIAGRLSRRTEELANKHALSTSRDRYLFIGDGGLYETDPFTAYGSCLDGSSLHKSPAPLIFSTEDCDPRFIR